MSDAEVKDDGDLPPSPGTLLRRRREQHGLSEQQAAEHLNLDVTAVMALERDDFEALGAPVFVRGHLRHYAALVGLPESELLHSYEHAKGNVASPTLVPKSRLEMAPSGDRAGRPWLIGGLLLILAGIAAAAYFSEYGLKWPQRDPVDSAAVSNSTATRLVAATEAPTGLGSAEPGPATGDGNTETGVADGGAMDPIMESAPGSGGSVAAAGQVGLELEFAADAWLEIYDRSGQAVVYDLGRGGTRRSVLAEAPLSVTVGNAGSVNLAVNGSRVSIPEPATGQTVSRFSIGPDGALR